MGREKLKVVEDDTTKFGHVLSLILAEKKLNQAQLAMMTDYSKPAISRVENGERKLSAKLAQKFEEVLGGSAESWLHVHDETENGNELPATYFRDYILGKTTADDLPGTRIRRISADEIREIFSGGDGTMTFRGVTEECIISDFELERVQVTSYDTRIGAYIDPDDPHEKLPIEIDDEIQLAPDEQLLIKTKEHIKLPSWLEADINPASNLAMKGLIVSHGPIIDPGWPGGFLTVSVYNPTKRARTITTREPFLTLRFWMQEAHRV